MRRLLENILRITAIVVILGWILIVFIDYFRAKKELDPWFCLAKETITYSDGEVFKCTGLGYKMFRYKRESINAVEFGPFYIKERTSAN